MNQFIFGGNTGVPTVEALKKKREIADLMMQRAAGSVPRNTGEGIAALGNALAYSYMDSKLGPQEEDARKSVADALAGFMGGGAQSGGYSGGGFTGQGMAGPAPGGSPAGATGPMAMPSGEFEQMAFRTAEKHGIDPALFVRQIKQESGFNPRAVSSAGAQGLGQLMPGTAAELGVTDPFDPEQNLDGAARYFKQQLDTFGTPDLALAAYNAGPGNVQKHGGVPPFEETQNYVASILGGGGGGGGGMVGGRQPDMGKVQAIAQVLSNPYADAGQKMVAQALIEREMSSGGGGIDPYQAAQLMLGKEDNQLAEKRFEWEKNKPTNDMREYEKAVAQGFKGTLIDHQLMMKKASAANVTTNVGDDTPADAAFYAKIDNAEGDLYAALLQQLPGVQRNAGTIDILEQQLASSPSGAKGAWVQMAGNLGIDVEGADDVQAATATINSMVPGQRPPGSGTMSDADLKLFKDSLPRIVNQPGGNALIVGKLRAINEYDRAISLIANDLVSRKITRSEARQKMADVPNPLSGYSTAVKAVQAAKAAPPAAPAAPTGGARFRYDPETGELVGIE